MSFFFRREAIVIDAMDGIDKWIDGRWYVFMNKVEILPEHEMEKINAMPAYRMDEPVKKALGRKKKV